MKSLKALFLIAMLMAALAIALSETTPISEEDVNHRLLRQSHGRHHHDHHHRGVVTAMTCNKYPSVCRAPGSEGPDCCKKKCVDVSRDRNNCGMCGKKCKYSQMCCKGKCMNIMFSSSHCGRCGNKCNKGDSCVYGICSYAN